MKKEGLKQKALEIGRVPTHLKLEIEDYGGDDKRAHFCWADPQDENTGIIVELDRTESWNPFPVILSLKAEKGCLRRN